MASRDLEGDRRVMENYSEPIDRLINEFSKLPGIGREDSPEASLPRYQYGYKDVTGLSKAW